MADLGVLIGALITGVVHARRIADEESAAVAEHYKDNPLLSGMSVPRVRVPEISIDIPMLIDAQDEGEADQVAEPKAIGAAVRKELKDSLAREGLSIAGADLKKFDSVLGQQLARIGAPTGYRSPREAVIRAAEEAFHTTVRSKVVDKSTLAAANRIVSNLRFSASGSALQKIGRAPQISASILTAEVKDKSSLANVSRMRITLKEEGLEWSIGENDDGTISRKLTPE
ncbi:MAG: hypothetical protein L3J63_04355 [Geopsychrobacter sp.]|nr:hypothetical protein [Geopsychrobacter sp.]